MCGRITVLTADELREVVAAVASELGGGREALSDMVRLGSSQERAHARPGGEVQALAADGGVTGGGIPGNPGQPAVATLTWGVVPPWQVEGASGGTLVFNTRIESALGGSDMWADAIVRGRCVLPAASFFEPHAAETVHNPKTGRKVKRAYEFRMASGEPLLLAAVRAGSRLSVVTTEPNRDVRDIHPRMPLALRFEEAPTWLCGGLDEIAALANRADVWFAVEPEGGSQPSNHGDKQLSLF